MRNVLTRQEARERGLKTYFTGAACPAGHVTERRIHNSECIECALLKRSGRSAAKYANDPDFRARAIDRAMRHYTARTERQRNAKAERVAGWIAAARLSHPGRPILTRNAALAVGSPTYFIGQPCPKGHISERATKGRGCLECRRALTAKWRDQNPDKVQANYARWHAENPGEVRAKNHRRRASLLAAEGTHTPEDIAEIRKAQKDRCAYCRKPLKGRGHIDHIHPLKPRDGGEPGRNDRTNLQLACSRCNVSKKDQHPMEFARKRGLLL